MAIVKNKKISRKLEDKIYSDLIIEFRKVNSRSTLEKFFDNLMTADEKIIFLKRFGIKNLLEGKVKYRDIKEIMSVSGNTISSVKDILEGRGYGRNPDRKRKYSISTSKPRKIKKFTLRYKGSASITDLL